MKKFNNKSGFTLIEIIVVLIIIGILAAIALPNLFQNVQTSQGGAALQTAAALETPIETCVNKNASTQPGTSPCDFSTILTNAVSGTTNEALAGSNFEVGVVVSGTGNASAGNLTYSLIGYDTGDKVAFTLSRNTAGIFSCAHGGNPYNNVC